MTVSKELLDLLDTTHYTGDGWEGLDSPPAQPDGRPGWDTNVSASDPDDGEGEGSEESYFAKSLGAVVRKGKKESYFSRCERDPHTGGCLPRGRHDSTQGGGRSGPATPRGDSGGPATSGPSALLNTPSRKKPPVSYFALSPDERAALKKTWAAAKKVEHKAMAGFRKSRELAGEVARQWGLSDTWADRVAWTLGFMDLAAAWTVNPAAGAALGASLAGPAGGVLGAKAAAWTPVFSLGFIATSSSVNPFKTIAAAKALVARHKTVQQKSGDRYRMLQKQIPGHIAKRLSEIPEGQRDWYLALLSAALDEAKGDATAALLTADSIFQHQAISPEDTDAPSNTP